MYKRALISEYFAHTIYLHQPQILSGLDFATSWPNRHRLVAHKILTECEMMKRYVSISIRYKHILQPSIDQRVSTALGKLAKICSALI